MSAICGDCGVDTTPRKRPGRQKEGTWEWYFVHDWVWLAAGTVPLPERKREWGIPTERAYEGYLCIGCLEERLQRRLMPDDFTTTEVTILDTPRLVNRKTSYYASH